MTKQFNVSNIKSILFYDNDYEQINNTTYENPYFEYVVAFNNIKSLTYDNETREFTIVSDDINFPIHSSDIYVIKNDMNKHDDFDKYVNILRAIHDYDVFMTPDEIKSIETQRYFDDETDDYAQRVYMISQTNVKYLLNADRDDCELMNDDELKTFHEISNVNDFTRLNDALKLDTSTHDVYDLNK